ncbi:MAG: tetratricopeptide repeat protein [Candidatus Sabulitectum sp.]|nr:tetratricopeptide repeat protein [Candidatus Sabulitectum sp.]
MRIIALNQLDWFFGSNLHVDEITYTAGDSPPFERPPGTCLLAGLSTDTTALRLTFSAISLIPALSLFLFRKKSRNNAILAGVLAIEPTLAFSGLQILPAAPAAAFLSLALTTWKSRPLLTGWLIGCAALFRGEVLLFLPVSIFFIRPVRRYISTAGGMIVAVLPVLVINLFSGGSFALGENGPLNLWLGSSWELLETPPGLEFEELIGDNSFADNALLSIKEDFSGWLGRGVIKTAAFLSIPGPGRNIEAPELLGSTILKYLLPLTFLLLALGISGLGRNCETALAVTGIIAAFIFFPSIRHRAVFLSALAVSASRFRWKIAAPVALLIVMISVFLNYPAGVRPGLTQVQLAQNQLESGNFETALVNLKRAEEEGFEGADMHSIRGACIASSGGDFHDAVLEFGMALEIAPESPTAWKNMAALLWNYGYIDDAVYAAEKAVNLNPALREELNPVLCGQR